MTSPVTRLRSLLGFSPGSDAPSGPKNVQEVIESLPESYRAHMREQQPRRRASAVAFLLIVFCLGGPLWHSTTNTPRVPFKEFSQEQRIPLKIRVILAATDKSILPQLNTFTSELLESLEKEEVQLPLSVSWEIDQVGLRELDTLSSDISKTDSFEARVALVPSCQWPHFSATNVHLGRNSWSFVQWTDEPSSKLLSRVHELLVEVLIDIPHLNAIVKRDLRERMQPWQIATLPLSHQKRLVWDSAPLSTNYVVQVIHLHDNESPGLEGSASVLPHLRRFAEKVVDATSIQLSSEHLWDFDVTSFFKKDVQDRWTLTHSGMERLIIKVDEQLQTVESEHSLIRLVILETKHDVIILDQYDEDSRGAVVAAWGAVVSRNDHTIGRLIASLRVLLGLDSELTSGWVREPVPIAKWEMTRLYIRAIVDNSMRARTATSTLKALTEKISTISIGNDVADRINRAVELVSNVGNQEGIAESLQKVKEGRRLADEAVSHPSLLALLYFPQDQKVAVYLPIMLPTLLPLFGSIWTISKWLFSRTRV